MPTRKRDKKQDFIVAYIKRVIAQNRNHSEISDECLSIVHGRQSSCTTRTEMIDYPVSRTSWHLSLEFLNGSPCSEYPVNLSLALNGGQGPECN